MFLIATLFYGLFGIASISGGVLGFLKAKSRASLIAGGISGILLLVASAALASGSTLLGLLLGGGTALLLTGRFVPAFIKTKKWMPQGMMAVMASIALLLSVACFLAI